MMTQEMKETAANTTPAKNVLVFHWAQNAITPLAQRGRPPHWCFECNVKRLDHTDKSLGAIIDRFNN
jgi:hypothetical protein